MMRKKKEKTEMKMGMPGLAKLRPNIENEKEKEN